MNKYLAVLLKLLVNVFIIAMGSYIIYYVMGMSAYSSVMTCGAIILLMGLMSFMKERLGLTTGYPIGTPVPENNVLLDAEIQKMEQDLSPEHINDNNGISTIFKKSNLEFILSGVVTIAIGLFMYYYL